MAESALRYLDQMYMMGIGQGPTAPRPQRTRGQEYADMLGAASLPLSGVPIAGDIAGFAADAAMYAAYPEERTLGNYAMSVLGGLPLIPGAAAIRAARSDSKAATNAINVQGIDIPIRKPSDNINNVMQANFNYPNIIGDQTLDINDIYGGVRLDPNERRRVDDLSAKISGEGGFISRIIVDQDNNVVEGQHRLEALRQLGASEVPVYKIEDLSSTLPVIEMENAINNSGKIHPDNVNRIMQYALENIAEHGVDGARDFDFGNYQKYYDAALRAARSDPIDMSTEARMQRATEGGYLPETYYHATSSDFEEFVPKYADQLTFITPNVNFANNWLGKGGSRSKLGSARYDDPLKLEYKAESEKIWDRYSTEYGVDINSWPEIEQQNYRAERNKVMNLFDSVDQSIYPLRTNVQNTFDPRRHEDVIVQYLQSQGRDPLATTMEIGITDLDYYKMGNYLLYENPEMVQLLKNKGFDSMRLAESTYDRSVAPVFDTLAVFNPSNIRSVNAAFDPANRRSANILATAAGGTISLSALRQLMPQEEERPIE